MISISWIEAIYICLTINNLMVFFSVYWPLIVNRYGAQIRAIYFMSTIFDTIGAKVKFYVYLLLLLIGQFYSGTVKRIDKHSFELTHVLNLEIVKFRVTAVRPSVIEIHNDKDESFLEQYGPYMRYEIIPWTPKTSVRVYYDNGTARDIRVN